MIRLYFPVWTVCDQEYSRETYFQGSKFSFREKKFKITYCSMVNSKLMICALYSSLKCLHGPLLNIVPLIIGIHLAVTNRYYLEQAMVKAFSPPCVAVHNKNFQFCGMT